MSVSLRLAFEVQGIRHNMSDGTSGRRQPERRAHVRYPVKLALRFLIRSGKFVSLSGEGTSINISSNGILFRSSKRLPDGEKVTAALQWPPTVDGKPVILLIHGQVVWIKGLQIGVSVSHYGFLSENLLGAGDLEDLTRLTLPRHLTPTKAGNPMNAGVHAWKKSVSEWK